MRFPDSASVQQKCGAWSNMSLGEGTLFQPVAPVTLLWWQLSSSGVSAVIEMDNSVKNTGC